MLRRNLLLAAAAAATRPAAACSIFRDAELYKGEDGRWRVRPTQEVKLYDGPCKPDSPSLNKGGFNSGYYRSKMLSIEFQEKHGSDMREARRQLMDEMARDLKGGK